MHFNKILVTTDLSDISKSSFDYASYQAKMEGSKVTLINVLEKWQIPAELRRVIWSPENIRRMEQEYLELAEEQLAQLAQHSFHGQEIETVLLQSNESPAKKICQYANEHDFDLIVIAAHGFGFVGTLLLGSTAQRVISESPCPVLVIRGEAKQSD